MPKKQTKTKPRGFTVAGAGWSRDYKHLRSAQRAHAWLTSQGYTACVVMDQIDREPSVYRVLVSRF